jgi:exopolyphosphatase/guanosine-5'-triphosphate,3'-diphosphate pyrophosphatase
MNSSAPEIRTQATIAGAPAHYAAIDMGSNSFRLEIAHLSKGRYRRIDYLKETVRLGAGLDAAGRLTEDAAQRGLDCLARFAQRLSGFEPSHVRAVATQTLREARNRDDFLLRAQTVLGHPIEVISGREEARLIFAGVARLQPSSLQRLVVDIGGRSTELILGHQRHPKRAESFQVGSVGLSMKYFSDGRFTEAAFRAAQVEAGAELEEAMVPFAASNWTEALGSSGTVGAVSAVLAANGLSDGRITPEGLRWLIERCLQAGRVEKLALPGLKEDRRGVIAGGLAILYTLAMNFGIDALIPARGALRQGVIFDLEERLVADAEPEPAAAHDMREATVRELQRRFEVDVAQADNVSRVAETIFHHVMPDAPAETRRELHWAAALHELGMAVSHHDYHRHSAYLLAHADAAGFSQSQQRRLGELVLAQRGGLRKVEATLSHEATAWQILCLRLAVIKCHARHQADPQAITITRAGAIARLSFSREWAQTHPRTLYLLREEAAAWDRSNAPLQLLLPN